GDHPLRRVPAHAGGGSGNDEQASGPAPRNRRLPCHARAAPGTPVGAPRRRAGAGRHPAAHGGIRAGGRRGGPHRRRTRPGRGPGHRCGQCGDVRQPGHCRRIPVQEAAVLAQVLRETGPARIAAITLDLDDTLWPIRPVMERCEQVLEAFLLEHAPAVARRFPRPAMRALRDAIAAERPDLAHDYAALRRLSLERAFAEAGVHEGAETLIEHAYVAFYAERSRAELFKDVPLALPALATRCRVRALTNGNADLERIGLAEHFHGAVLAREVGVGKPDARIFAHACRLLGTE